jgi:hypothetical protein
VLNKQWLAEPYLINYITGTRDYILTDGVSTTFRFNVSINQEVPLQLILYLEANETFKTSQDRLLPYDGDRRLIWNYIDEFTQIETDNTGLPQSGSGMSMMYEYNDTYTPLPMLLYSYDFIVNGVRKQSNSLISNISWVGAQNVESILEDMVTYNSFNMYKRSTTKSIRNTNYGIGNYFTLTLDPGNMVDYSYRSTSVGAQTATLELQLYSKGIAPYDAINNPLQRNLTPSYYTTDQTIMNTARPIGKGYRVTIVKVMPEQLRLDINRNVTKVKFPAVASNNDIQIQMSNIINAN